MYSSKRYSGDWNYFFDQLSRKAYRKWRKPITKLAVIGCGGAFVFFILSMLQYNTLSQRTSQLDHITNSVIGFQEYYNKAIQPFNSDKFQLEENYIPIVIYVYERPQYFTKVIDALRQVKGIKKTLLIVSHDSVKPEMLDLVNKIDFCQVKQLFHPVSSNHPSNAGALKEHWYWLLKTLYTQLFSNYNGDICFIEEDHTVSPDFYETLKVLSAIKQKGFVKDVSTVALGSYFTDGLESPATLVSYQGFINTGYAFNRTVWDSIVKYERIFNETDDDWDTSLVDGLMKRKYIPNAQITPQLSRICNIGQEGIHKTQIIADRCEKGLYPVSKGETDWNNIDLVEVFQSPSEQKTKLSELSPHSVCRTKTQCQLK